MTALPMSGSLLSTVQAAQRPDGSFAATVQLGSASLLDSNGFVTALAIRALSWYDPEQTALIQARAVSFLQRFATGQRWCCRH